MIGGTNRLTEPEFWDQEAAVLVRLRDTDNLPRLRQYVATVRDHRAIDFHGRPVTAAWREHFGRLVARYAPLAFDVWNGSRV